MTDYNTMRDHVDDMMQIQAKLHRYIDRMYKERDAWRAMSAELADVYLASLNAQNKNPDDDPLVQKYISLLKRI